MVNVIFQIISIKGEEMSLDVYLTLESVEKTKAGSGIFVREDGQIKEISRTEWDEKFPYREPLVARSQYGDDSEVYSANITHNLNKMATKAGIYEYLWRPDEFHIVTAEQLIKPLQEGLKTLKDDPSRFKMFNPSNGWGSYDVLVGFVKNYLAACEQYPEAVVSVRG